MRPTPVTLLQLRHFTYRPFYCVKLMMLTTAKKKLKKEGKNRCLLRMSAITTGKINQSKMSFQVLYHTPKTEPTFVRAFLQSQKLILHHLKTVKCWFHFGSQMNFCFKPKSGSSYCLEGLYVKFQSGSFPYLAYQHRKVNFDLGATKQMTVQNGGKTGSRCWKQSIWAQNRRKCYDVLEA